MKRALLVWWCLAAFAPAVAAADSVESPPSDSMRVDGTFTTQVVPCESLCTESVYTGDLKGVSRFTLISLEPTSIPNVSKYVGHLVLTTPDGSLIGRDVGYWNLVTGEYNDLYRITGGTGVYKGAVGLVRLWGTLDPVTGTGSSRYVGWITWTFADDE